MSNINEFDYEWYVSGEHEELIGIANDINEHGLDRICAMAHLAINSSSIIEKEDWLQQIRDISKTI